MVFSWLLIGTAVQGSEHIRCSYRSWERCCLRAWGQLYRWRSNVTPMDKIFVYIHTPSNTRQSLWGPSAPSGSHCPNGREASNKGSQKLTVLISWVITEASLEIAPFRSRGRHWWHVCGTSRIHRKSFQILTGIWQKKKGGTILRYYES